MGQIQTTISMVLIGLFTIAIIGFGISFANNNSTPISIADDPELSSLYSKTQSEVSSFRADSQSQYQSIVETTIDTQTQTTQSVGPFAITPTNAIGVVTNILKVGYTKIFGTGSGFGIFLTTLIAMIVFVIGLYLYKTLRGIPD